MKFWIELERAAELLYNDWKDGSIAGPSLREWSQLDDARKDDFRKRAIAQRVAPKVIGAVLDLQPLAESQNKSTRVWEMYPSVERGRDSMMVPILDAILQS